MSDSSDEDVLTPVQNAEMSLLPEKSRLKYMKAFDHFNTWRHKNGAKTFSETVILSYFIDLAKSVKPSTLWSIYSMLKATLKLKKGVHIEKYPELLAFIKKTSSGHKPKKSKIFTAADITKYLKEAPDSEHLGTKVVLIIGISGACRTQELTYLKTSNVEKHSETLLLFKIPDTKTNIERNFVVRDEYMEVVKKYLNLRPPKASTDRFFLGYRKGKCINQPMGPNKIGSLPREIATYLGLASPKQYTGHCFRRTSATLLADSGADLTALKRHGRWTSTVTEGYLDDSIENKSKLEEPMPQPGASGNHSYEATYSDQESLDSNASETGHEAPFGIQPQDQCRFCAGFSKDCINVTEKDRPYLTRNKTALTLNDLSVEVDFNDALPKTVCQACDSKLLVMFDFVQQVKEAQYSLNVRVNIDVSIENLTVKTECDSPTPEDDDDIDSKDGVVDSLIVSETVFIKPINNYKRKTVEDTPKTQKKPKVTKNVEINKESEWIIDIKEETAETDEYETEKSKFNETRTVTESSEFELGTRALVSEYNEMEVFRCFSK